MSRRRQHERKPSAAPADAGRKPDAGKSGAGKTDIAKPDVAKPEAGPLDPFAILVDYERKSLAHVAGLPEQLDAPGLWRGVGYRIGQRRLASGFDEVVEILPMPQVTPVPGSQPWMLGVANIRGNLLPTVDLKQFLEGERTVLHEGQRVLIVRQPGGDVAGDPAGAAGGAARIRLSEPVRAPAVALGALSAARAPKWRARAGATGQPGAAPRRAAPAFQRAGFARRASGRGAAVPSRGQGPPCQVR